jgi:hypothetical protein
MKEEKIASQVGFILHTAPIIGLMETTQKFIEHISCLIEKFKWRNLPYWKNKRWFG